MQLEDELEDVFAKALKGLGLDPETAASQAQRPLDELATILSGGHLPKNKDQSLNQVAINTWSTTLGLNPDAVTTFHAISDAPALPTYIHQLVTDFGHVGVNSWLIKDSQARLLIDAGTDGNSLLRQLNTLGETPTHLVITHAHRDHIAGLHRLAQAFPNLKIFCPATQKLDIESHPLEPGDRFLNYKIFDLAGHYCPAIGLLENDGKLAIVGDAIFKQSIGGIPHPEYQRGLENIRQLCSAAQPDCLILTGHGAATTMAAELRDNPFLG